MARKPKGPPPPLVIALHDPGMTPMLRAGLGGLAASLYAIHQRQQGGRWPAPVSLGPGRATVDARTLTLEWGDAAPEETLEALFKASFQIRDGLIYLPGAYHGLPLGDDTLCALQSALRRTFLQHGKSAKKDGAPDVVSILIDEQPTMFEKQRYLEFAHQKAAKEVVSALKKGAVELASWAYPGAVQRHAMHSSTKWAFSPAEVLCGLFAIVGGISYTAGSGAVLVIPQPSNLVQFAHARPHLTPQTREKTRITGVGDAVLTAETLIRNESALLDGVAGTTGVLFKILPWASQLKSRGAIVHRAQYSDEVLDQYYDLTRTLPAKIKIAKSDKKGALPSSFVALSALRGFVADNLAQGRRWFQDFATATTDDKKPKHLHRYRTRDDDLGALYKDDKKGLTQMLEHLEVEEQALVRSVHQALRQRFGAIYEEAKKLGSQAIQNRMNRETEKLRLAFAGAKTHDQLRGALADLWSRAGKNAELEAHWTIILPLLRRDRWRLARDLALVAIASYPSQKRDDDTEQKD